MRRNFTINQAFTVCLQQLLMKDSTATVSISSEVINLCTLYPTLTYDRVCQAIAEEFYDAHQVSASRQVKMYL